MPLSIFSSNKNRLPENCLFTFLDKWKLQGGRSDCKRWSWRIVYPIPISWSVPSEVWSVALICKSFSPGNSSPTYCNDYYGTLSKGENVVLHASRLAQFASYVSRPSIHVALNYLPECSIALEIRIKLARSSKDKKIKSYSTTPVLPKKSKGYGFMSPFTLCDFLSADRDIIEA